MPGSSFNHFFGDGEVHLHPPHPLITLIEQNLNITLPVRNGNVLINFEFPITGTNEVFTGGDLDHFAAHDFEWGTARLFGTGENIFLFVYVPFQVDSPGSYPADAQTTLNEINRLFDLQGWRNVTWNENATGDDLYSYQLPDITNFDNTGFFKFNFQGDLSGTYYSNIFVDDTQIFPPPDEGRFTWRVDYVNELPGNEFVYTVDLIQTPVVGDDFVDFDSTLYFAARRSDNGNYVVFVDVPLTTTTAYRTRATVTAPPVDSDIYDRIALLYFAGGDPGDDDVTAYELTFIENANYPVTHPSFVTRIFNFHPDNLPEPGVTIDPETPEFLIGGIDIEIEQVIGEIDIPPQERLIGDIDTSPTEFIIGEIDTPPQEYIIGEIDTPATERLVGEIDTDLVEHTIGEIDVPTVEFIIGEIDTTATEHLIGGIGINIDWALQYTIPLDITPIVGFARQYAIDVYIAPLDWQLQYTIPHAEIAYVPDWQLQYTIIPSIGGGPNWRTQYSIDTFIQPLDWRLQYTIPVDISIADWQTQYTIPVNIIPPDDWQTQYEFDVFIEGALEVPLANISWNDLLRYSVGWGRSEAAYGAICNPLQGQIILDNNSGVYDDPAILPNEKVDVVHTAENGVSYTVAHGWVSNVQHLTDHATGNKTTTVHIRGALQQLARADYELALFLTDTVRTGEIINEVMDHVNRADIMRNIDVGQVRLHPAHYTSVLTPRRLTNALHIIRATEAAEVGFVHEKRGDVLTFEDRFHREVDETAPRHTFGIVPTDIQIEGKVTPDLNWDNVYTVVQAGAERAVVQATGRVFTLGGKEGNAQTDKIWDFPAGVTYTFVCDLDNDEDAREHPNVKSVASWEPTDHVIETDAPGLEFAYTYTQTKAVVTVHNPTSNTIHMTKMELHGAGVALYGDLTIAPREAPLDILQLYGRKYLNLPVSFIGDGINYGGDPTVEGNAFADMLLLRYSQPIITGRLDFNPLQSADAINAFVDLNIGDAVTVTDGTGLDAGIYYVEGGEIQFDADRGDGGLKMTAIVSKRGRKFNLKRTPLDVQPAGKAWEVVDQGRALLDTRVYIIGAHAQFPAGTIRSTDEDETVMRVVADGKVVKEWAEQDFPAQDEMGEFIGTLINADANTGTPELQIRQAPNSTNNLTVSRYSIFRVDR